jgi:hypothetical protein
MAFHAVPFPARPHFNSLFQVISLLLFFEVSW